jgi:hypothetical protein
MEKDINFILEQSYRLFFKYGVRSVTMDDIAREIGISKKTLYHHVADKEELLQKVIYSEFVKHEKRHAAVYDQKNNAIEQLLELNRVLNETHKEINPAVEYDLKKYHPRLYTEFRNIRHDCIKKWIRMNLQKGIEENLYRNDLNVEIITLLHVTTIETVAELKIFTEEGIDTSLVIYELFVYHLRGICSKEGIKYLEKRLDELKILTHDK